MDGRGRRGEERERESLKDTYSSGRDVGSVLGICDRALVVEGCRRQESVCTLKSDCARQPEGR